MIANVFLILHLALSIFPLFLDAASWLLFPFLLFCRFGSSAHRCVIWYSHQGHGIIPAVLWLLGLLYQLKEFSPAFVSSWLRSLLCFGLLGCGLWHTPCCWVFKGHVLVCLVTRLSPASASSCLYGCGWGKISRAYNVLRRNLYSIWQHYPVDGCQEYDLYRFLGSFSDLRCKFDMYSGKHVLQKNFKEEFIPHISILQVFTLLKWTPDTFTVSL